MKRSTSTGSQSTAHSRVRGILIALVWVRAILITIVALAGALLGTAVHSASPPTPTSIAQVPLTVAIPAHPQILFAIGNSQSMDGTLSGAIMTGSGGLDPSLSALQNSSSPTSYAVPAGFTPPVDPGAAGSAPITSMVNGVEIDNSASRLNVAKAAVTSMLNSFMTTADFGLMEYQSSATWAYTTWVYQMSPTGGPFVFTNGQISGNRYAANPCYNYKNWDTSSLLYTDCQKIDASGQLVGDISGSQYMQISASSDDPLINDVLYSVFTSLADWGQDPVCLIYGGPSPANPYPPNYTLSRYNTGGIWETYSNEVNPCVISGTPSNAGFVPSTPQVIYSARGFGYDGIPAVNTGNVLVGVTSAGQAPTASSVAAALAQFTPLLAPETNSPATTEIKASAQQSPLAGLLAGAQNYFQHSTIPSSNGCKATQYVVLITDGLPTLDMSGNSWPPPGTTSATQYGLTVAFNSDGSLNASGTNSQAVIDTITQLSELAAAGIKTYVIGLGAGVDPTQNPAAAQVLKAMAVAGGTGAYFAATSPAALTNDMQSIMANIISATQSTDSLGVNSTGLNKNSVTYQAHFTTADVYQDWTGDLDAFSINPVTGAMNTGAGAALWSAQAQLDQQNWDSGRFIATWDPVSKAGIPFRWNPSTSATTGIAAPSTKLGQAFTTFTQDPSGQDVLNYLRGNSAQEQRNGGQFRNRSHKLADIVSSTPLYVGPPGGLNQTVSYFNFENAQANRPPVLYVGADDGMLHAFDAETGEERFAFIPNGVYSNLINLVNPYYNEQHLFYVNGSPVTSDVQFSDSSWHTVLVGGEGAGGNTIYALDVTDPTSITSETALAKSVLWEFSDPNMGMSFSQPTFATTNASPGQLVFFGNGYDSPNERPFLYAVNPQNGQTVANIDLCSQVVLQQGASSPCDLTQANGLSSVAVVNNSGLVTVAANVVYAGDLQGNLWRVDISNSNSSNWVVTVIFQARDPNNNLPQPITITPAITLNPQFPMTQGTLVVFGTGQFLGWPDLANTQVQTLYAVFDPPSGSSGILTRSSLIGQTLTASTVGSIAVRIVQTTNPVVIPANWGWYVDLSVNLSQPTGERIVVNPTIEAGSVVAVSYQPNTNACIAGGTSWLYVLNYATGGSFPLPELDINQDGVLNSNDETATGANPVAIEIGPFFASAPSILNTPPHNGISQQIVIPGGSGVAPGGNGTTSGGGGIAASGGNQAASGGDGISSGGNGTTSGNTGGGSGGTPVGQRGSTKQRSAWWEVLH